MTNYQKYTDDLIALIVVGATVSSYFVSGVDIPTEPMMLVLGYFFGKKAAALGSSTSFKTGEVA